MFILIKYKKY